MPGSWPRYAGSRHLLRVSAAKVVTTLRVKMVRGLMRAGSTHSVRTHLTLRHVGLPNAVGEVDARMLFVDVALRSLAVGAVPADLPLVVSGSTQWADLVAAGDLGVL